MVDVCAISSLACWAMEKSESGGDGTEIVVTSARLPCVDNELSGWRCAGRGRETGHVLRSPPTGPVSLQSPSLALDKTGGSGGSLKPLAEGSFGLRNVASDATLRTGNSHRPTNDAVDVRPCICSLKHLSINKSARQTRIGSAVGIPCLECFSCHTRTKHLGGCL